MWWLLILLAFGGLALMVLILGMVRVGRKADEHERLLTRKIMQSTESSAIHKAMGKQIPKDS